MSEFATSPGFQETAPNPENPHGLHMCGVCLPTAHKDCWHLAISPMDRNEQTWKEPIEWLSYQTICACKEAERIDKWMDRMMNGWIRLCLSIGFCSSQNIWKELRPAKDDCLKWLIPGLAFPNTQEKILETWLRDSTAEGTPNSGS